MNTISGIAIKAIAAAVPTLEVKTADYPYFSHEEKERFQKATGIKARRIVRDGQCASDLCMAAAEEALDKLGWARESIGALVMITQTGDQPVPATSIVLQDKLGLPQNCIAFDINLGCSSYPYGLAIVGSLMNSLGIPRALLLIGDVSSRVCSFKDKSAWPLFGDAGTATALEIEPNAPKMYFDLMSDGAGKNAIIIPAGGLASRNPISSSREYKDYTDNSIRSPENMILQGADIFSFAISKVPPSIMRAMELSGKTKEELDYLVLHQANKMINDNIAKKIGFSSHKVPESLEFYGNTSSASIPITLCANSKLFSQERSILLSGFGVGLSWGSAVVTISGGVVLACTESNHVD